MVQFIITGIGGQGILTLSRIIANAAIKYGYKVRIGETLGMSQRFGSVVSYVRLGTEVFSPLPIGLADIIISMELNETFRVWKYIGNKTVVIVNTEIIPSILTSLSFLPKYRDFVHLEKETMIKELRKVSKRLIHVDGYSLLKKNDLPKQSLNTFLLGIVAKQSENPIEPKYYEEAIKEVLPEHVTEYAIRAFRLGLNYCKIT